MIYNNGKKITAIYHDNKAIIAVYYGKRLVWQISNGVLSCFANGYWIDENPWTDDQPWKDND